MSIDLTAPFALIAAISSSAKPPGCFVAQVAAWIVPSLKTSGEAT